MTRRRCLSCHLKRPAQVRATPPGRDNCHRTPGSSPTSHPQTSGDAGYRRSSSSRTAPAGPATGRPYGSGGRSRRSPAGDHSTGAPAADAPAAAAPAAPTHHRSGHAASACPHPPGHPSGNDPPRSTGHALVPGRRPSPRVWCRTACAVSVRPPPGPVPARDLILAAAYRYPQAALIAGGGDRGERSAVAHLTARARRSTRRPRNLGPSDDPVYPRVRKRAGDTNGGGANVVCGRRRDGASWLAWMSIRSGRYVPSSENPAGQLVALECPERPGGGVGPAAEFVRQFCFRRQLGTRRVLAVPDPPREHGVNVRVGLRVLPRIIQTSHTGSVTAPALADFLCSIWKIRAWPHQRMVYARVTTSPGRRQKRAFTSYADDA